MVIEHLGTMAVLVGTFPVQNISERKLISKGVITDSELDLSPNKDNVYLPVVSKVETSKFQILATADRVHMALRGLGDFSTLKERIPPLVELLDGTVTAGGLNFNYCLKLDDPADFFRVSRSVFKTESNPLSALMADKNAVYGSSMLFDWNGVIASLVITPIRNPNVGNVSIVQLDLAFNFHTDIVFNPTGIADLFGKADEAGAFAQQIADSLLETFRVYTPT